MAKLWKVGLYAQALVYVLSGINHFLHERFYLHLMPTHYAHPAELVRWSGAAEMVGGLGLLVPASRRFAAGGISLMLLVFCDVHVFMVRHPERFPEVPGWVLWGRLPVQFVLIAWAWHYTRRTEPEHALTSGEA